MDRSRKFPDNKTFSATFLSSNVCIVGFVMFCWLGATVGGDMQRSPSPGVELYNGGEATPPRVMNMAGPGLGPFSASRTSSVSSASTSFADRAQSPTRLTADAKRYKYLRRILKFRQMDFEYAFWQMLYLLVAPQKVYVQLCRSWSICCNRLFVVLWCIV